MSPNVGSRQAARKSGLSGREEDKMKGLVDIKESEKKGWGRGMKKETWILQSRTFTTLN